MNVVRLSMKWIVLAILLLLIPAFVPNSYIMQIINMVGIFCILAMGLNLLTGYTGQLSLGHGAFYGIGAYTAAILNTRLGVPFLLTLPAALAITAVFGVILAIPALKVKGSYLALLTIGFGEIIRLILINWISLTRGPNGILNIEPPIIFGVTIRSLFAYYYIILFFVAALMLYLVRLIRSRAGLALLAIRDDDNAAKMVGINVTQYKVKAFVISAMYCSVAGWLYAHMIRYVSPDSFRGDESQIILCTVIIGGIGTFKGPILGAILLLIMPELLRGLDNMRMVLYGILLVIVIMFFPGGISNYLDRLLNWMKRMLRRRETISQSEVKR